jgi:ACS family 4-hydroxyphenylacetate permease-like MFS transporter
VGARQPDGPPALHGVFLSRQFAEHLRHLIAQIIREVLGGSTTPFVVGLVGAIPPIFTIIGMVLCAPDSDRTGERLRHTPSCGRSRRRLDNRGLECDSGNPSDGVDSRVGGRLYRHGLVLGVLHAPTEAGAEAASIALISTAGILGSATSPTIVGFLRDLTHSFNSGLWYAVGLLMLGTMTILIVSRTGPKYVSAD